MDARSDQVSDLSFDQLMELDRRAAEREAHDDDGGGTDDEGGGPGDDDGDDDAGVIVLPWWQHPVNIVTMVVTAAILAGMIGWMVGENASRIEYDDVDTGFLQDMRVHHEQAVLMGLIYRNLPDTDPGLRAIARSIVVGQSVEVGRMVQLLRSFGESEINDSDTSMLWMDMVAETARMPGMATEAELDELGRLSGDDADELFVALMTEHHIGGIEMAEFAAENADNEEVRKMAAGMADAQTGEIAEMESLLE